jgi:regulator of protease activity HflC (stomatin/prohibitin superfamily)
LAGLERSFEKRSDSNLGEKNVEDQKIVKWIGVGVASIIALLVIFGSYFTVKQYERGVVTTWGKISYVADPGLSFKVPLVQSVTYLRTDILSLQPEKKVNTYTDDNQEIDILFTVFYRIPPAKVAFVYENAQDYRDRLFNIANDRLKAEMGKVKLEHFAAHRGEVRDRVKVTMVQDALVLGVEVTDFQLTDVDYTRAFRVAVEGASVQKAGVETREWERQQAEKSALTAKITAEGVANGVREKAKGEADATLVVAQAEAKAIKLKGEAQADAMRAQAEALSRNPVLVEMRKAEKWDGALPHQMLSGITPFMQFQAPTAAR